MKYHCQCFLILDGIGGVLALRKKLCKNNQLQKNDFVLRATDQSLSSLFQYKLNTAVCQAPMQNILMQRSAAQ